MFPNSHQVFQLSGKLFVLTAPETLLPHSHLPIWAPKSIDWEYERQDFWKKLYNQIESHQSQHQQHQQLTTQDSAIEMHTSTQNDHTSTSSGDNTSTSSAAPEYFGVIMVDVDKVEQVDHSLWPHRQMLHSTVMPERTFGRICSNRWVAKDVTAATNSLTTSLLLAKKKVTQ